MELGGNNGGRGGREAESAGKKVGQARERDGVGARQGEEGRGRSRREEMLARRRRAASAAPAAAELCSAHRRAPHERGKGNGEAKSDLAIATATTGLSGGVTVGTATRGIAGPVRRRRGKTVEAQ